MIGRYSKLGVYRELFTSRSFYIVAASGLLAAISFFIANKWSSAIYLSTTMALASVAINGGPIVWGALQGLVERRINADELVSLAIVASLVQGEFLSAAVVGFVMALGGLVEEATSESARRAIRSLIRISPKTATVLSKSSDQRTVDVRQVAVGDRILIKPGEQIPVDAVIFSGMASIDASTMTGEPLPREVKSGDTVLSGTLNLNGVLAAEAVKVGRDTTLGKIIQLVGEAEQHRPEAVRLIDRYARWFTPVILSCAVGAWWLTGDAARAVAVLIVGCPCALILAAPTATVAALGRAAKAGLLVKGGARLERVAEVSAVFFDKTGTLTMGEPRVEEMACAPGVKDSELPACAASAEQNCTHPLARAILKAAHYAKQTPDQKSEVIRQYQERQRPVMFVGDGINDAPALAAAHVGVAMAGAGTDVALETADIALIHDDIAKLPWLVRLARHMLATIKVNIVFGLIFNATAVVAGGMGWLSPISAAVVHNIGSVLVVLYSARLAIFPENAKRWMPGSE